jgi:hypothetical protein
MMNLSKQEIYQWDKGVFLEFDENEQINQVHFSHLKYGKSTDVDVIDGVCKVPDKLLRTCGTIYAWGVMANADGMSTEFVEEIKVVQRARPSDYVYSYDDLERWEKLQEQIGNLEELNTEQKDNLVKAINEAYELGGVSTEEVESIVSEYFKKNPIVKTINGKEPDENGNIQINIPTVNDIIASLPMWEGGEY